MLYLTMLQSLLTFLVQLPAFVQMSDPRLSAMATDKYDFLVVGGGTSGLVIANRLSEDPNARILVLEAGEDHLSDPNVLVPGLSLALQGTATDWNFSTTPQVRATNMIGNEVLTQHEGESQGPHHCTASGKSYRWLERHQPASAYSTVQNRYRYLGEFWK